MIKKSNDQKEVMFNKSYKALTLNLLLSMQKYTCHIIIVIESIGLRASIEEV